VLATTRAALVIDSLGSGYYDAVAAYFVAGGDPDQALRLRGQQLARRLEKKVTLGEFRCRLARCKLLALLGRPFEDELAAVRAAASQLKDPTFYLSALAEIKGDEGGRA